jgi:hypothetical protein
MLVDFLIDVDPHQLLWRKSHHRASLTPKLPYLFPKRKPNDDLEKILARQSQISNYKEQ